MVISFTTMAFLSFAELSVTLEPEETSRFVYEPFTLLLHIGDEAERPEIPDGAAYSVTAVRPVEDGFRIEIVAQEPGTLTLPPFTVTAGKQSVQTPILRLPVAEPRRADEMELSLKTSATTLFAGQPVKLTVIWKSSVPFTRCQELLLELPLLYRPDWEAYPLDPGVPEKDRIGLPVNAQRMIAKNEPGQLSFSYQLVPRAAGSFKSSARLSCALLETRNASSQYPSYFDNHFFNVPDKRDHFERIYLSAPETVLTVRALPEAGRSALFSGIVGSCTAAATLEPENPIVGQPMLLTVTLSDLSFSGHIRNLPEATLNGLGSEFQVTKEPMHTSTEGNTKSFTYVVRPLRCGIDVLPALAFQIFDPETETYRTVRTAPLPINVTPDGKQTFYTPSRKSEPLIPQTGIRNNRKESEPTMYAFLEFLTEHPVIFWPLPVFLWLILRPWLRRRDRGRTDPAYARAVRAMHRFNRSVQHDETAAWKTYLADRFDLTAEAVTFAAVKPHLDGLTPELMQAVHDRFEAEETTDYAPPGTPALRAAAARKLVKKLEKAIPVLLLLLALLPAQSDAVPADDLFERAMTIRAERPDEAAPLFTEAALEFEHEKRFYNAANSWFFAGHNGRSLANYRAAQSRRPFDKQIRESITFIRTQRADNFQSLENSSSVPHRVSKVWKKFCQWSPALRFGLLTLMYLIAWAAWLTARIAGRTIPRKAWIIQGGLASVVALSLVWSVSQPSEGVVIQAAEARLGPGYAYEPAYDDNILPEATEFQWLEEHDGWVHARLPDDSDAWIRETACVKIR